jgi:hypothetical protein
LDPVDGRPLRCSPDWTSGRLIELVAGAGTVWITTEGLVGVLTATADGEGIGFRLARQNVEFVMVDRRATTVQLLAPARFGAVTLLVLGGAIDRLRAALDLAGFPPPA